ncbi:hypothetical protein MTO96_021845 [Rhipicephalus appendiculatus]
MSSISTFQSVVVSFWLSTWCTATESNEAMGEREATYWHTSTSTEVPQRATDKPQEPQDQPLDLSRSAASASATTSASSLKSESSPKATSTEVPQRATDKPQEPQDEPLDLSRSAASTSATTSASSPKSESSPKPSPSPEPASPSPDALAPSPDAVAPSLEPARSFATLDKYVFRKSQDGESKSSSGKSSTDTKSSSLSFNVVSPASLDSLSSGSGNMSVDASRAPSPAEGRISSLSEGMQMSVRNTPERSDSTVPEEFFARQLGESADELEATECAVDPTALVALQLNVAGDVTSTGGPALGSTDSQELEMQMSLTSEGLSAMADDDEDEDTAAFDVLSELVSTMCPECGAAFENAGMVIEHRILVHDFLPG